MNYLPLGLQAAIWRISLVSFTAIAASLIEKEKFTIIKALSICLGFIGIILMVQPDFMLEALGLSPDDDRSNSSMAVNEQNVTQRTSLNTEDNKKTFLLLGEISGRMELVTGICLDILATFLATLMAVFMKRKTLSEFCLWNLTFWVGVVGMVWPCILSLVTNSLTWIPDPKIIALLLTDSVMVTVGIVFYLIAIRKISYLIVSIIMSISIAFNLVPQYFIIKGQFVEKLFGFEIVGAILTIIAASLPTVAEIVKSKPKVDGV